METEKLLVKEWFKKWDHGDFMNLPISKNFKHHSPFGIIDGKKTYIEMVNKNKDKFLGYRFVIHDQLFFSGKACVRYLAIQDNFELEVSEWYYFKDNLINEIFAYYHIGEIREDRQLK